MPSKPRYHCTQTQLVTLATTGWGNYLRQLPAFATLRGYYTQELATQALAAIDAANALPDSQVRSAQLQVLHIQLQQQASHCLSHWQQLKRYILTSFPTDTLRFRLSEAGAARYAKAQNHNWQQLQSLNTSAANFLATHSATLSAGQNMPASFASSYQAHIATFDTLFIAFIGAEQAAYNATHTKIAAFNSIYASLITMFADGQALFKNQTGLRRQFTFTHVLALITTHSSPQDCHS